MSAKALLLIAVILAFGALSALALVEHGYLGIFAFHFTSSAGMQVLSDLVIVCALAMIWMLLDARRTGRRVWPFLVMTVTLGSFGPLLYLLVGELQGSAAKQAYA